MRLAEMKAHKPTPVVDTTQLVMDAVSLFTQIVQNKEDDGTLVHNEDEGFQCSGTDLVFLDFSFQHQTQERSSAEVGNSKQIPIVDILDDWDQYGKQQIKDQQWNNLSIKYELN